jgi:flagellar hook-length control protein FliK
MSNLLGNLINLLSTQKATVAASGNQSKSSPDGLPFEKVLHQVESQNQDSNLSQAGTQAQEIGREAALSSASAMPATKDPLPAVSVTKTQAPQETIHLSIQAASLEAGMKQVTQLLQSLSSLSDEQGAALVSSLTGGAVSKADALGFVQNLKSILNGLSTKDASALQSQWLDRIQQDTQANTTLAQAMGAMSQSVAMLPNQALNAEASQTGATVSGNSNSPWASLQSAGFSFGQTDADLFDAGAGITTIQMPSDWKVTTSASLAKTSVGSTGNLQALVDLLTQSNAGKVLLSQAVAYEFNLKVSSQSGSENVGLTVETASIKASAPIVLQQNSVVDAAFASTTRETTPDHSPVQTVSNAIQEIQSQTQLLSAATTPVLDSSANSVVVSPDIQTDQTITSGVNVGLNSAVKDGLQQSVVLRLDNTVANNQTSPLTNTSGSNSLLNPMPVATTVSEDSNLTTTAASGLAQAENSGLSVSSSVTNPSDAVLNAAPLPVVDSTPNLASASKTVLSTDIAQKTVSPVGSQKISVTEELPPTTLTPGSALLPSLPIEEPQVSNNSGDANVEQKNTVAVEMPQVAAASNQAVIPSVLGSEKGMSQADPSSLATATSAISTVPVAIPEAVSKTVAAVESASTHNNPPSTVALNVSNITGTSPAVSQNANGSTVSLKVDQSSEPITGFKVKTDTQNTTWTVVTTAVSDARSANQDGKPGSSSIQPESLIQQIANQVSVEAGQSHSVSHLSFQLVPENLGKITIQVSLVDQLVTAKILVTHADVREALQNNLVELKTSLYQAGLQIDQLQVQVQGGGAGLLAQYYQFQQEGNGQSSRVAQEESVKRESKDVPAEIVAAGGSWNTVNLLV